MVVHRSQNTSAEWWKALMQSIMYSYRCCEKFILLIQKFYHATIAENCISVEKAEMTDVWKSSYIPVHVISFIHFITSMNNWQEHNARKCKNREHRELWENEEFCVKLRSSTVLILGLEHILFGWPKPFTYKMKSLYKELAFRTRREI